MELKTVGELADELKYYEDNVEIIVEAETKSPSGLPVYTDCKIVSAGERSSGSKLTLVLEAVQNDYI